MGQWYIQIYEHQKGETYVSNLNIFELGALAPTYVLQRVRSTSGEKKYYFVQNLSGDLISFDTLELRDSALNAQRLVDTLLMANPVTHSEPQTHLNYITEEIREILTTTQAFPELTTCNEVELIIKTPEENAEAILRIVKGESLYSRHQVIASV